MERGRTRLLVWMLIAASLFVPTQRLLAQGLLSTLSESVRTPSASEPSADESTSNRKSGKRWHLADSDYKHGDDNDSDNWFGLLLVGGAVVAVTAPIWMPIKIASDDYSSAGYFPEYPYQHGIGGYMMIDPWVPSEPFTYSLQTRAEFADNFSGISRIGTHLLFDTTTRFGIESEVNHWRESLGIGQHDDLWTGDANLVFRFAQSEWMQMRTGLGMNWLADDIGTDLGFNFTYQGDFFPADPWIISAELDLGSLGDETLVHGRVTTGLHWHRAEVFIGYDYYKIDRTELSGFVSGLRLWF